MRTPKPPLTSSDLKGVSAQAAYDTGVGVANGLLTMTVLRVDTARQLLQDAHLAEDAAIHQGDSVRLYLARGFADTLAEHLQERT